MTLDEYLRGGNDTAAELAKKCGVSAASISRIRNGRQNISLTLAKEIVAKTGGKVTLDGLAERAQ